MNEHSFIFAPEMRIRDNKKEKIIREKAIEIIVKEGFDGLSMQKLAKAAGVSPATIYIYFENREDFLNQLFNQIQITFSKVVLKNFHSQMSFEEGLWLQWKNRLKFILKYPTYFTFMEQFRHSPLVNHNDVNLHEFKEVMRDFIMNAIKQKEIKKTEPEIFWALAYGPFYTLVKFQTQKKTIMNNNFKLTNAKLKEAFDMTIKAFKIEKK